MILLRKGKNPLEKVRRCCELSIACIESPGKCCEEFATLLRKKKKETLLKEKRVYSFHKLDEKGSTDQLAKFYPELLDSSISIVFLSLTE